MVEKILPRAGIEPGTANPLSYRGSCFYQEVSGKHVS